MSGLEISGFVLEIVKTVAGPVKEHSDYAFYCKYYVEQLESACTNLERLEKAIQDWVDAAFRNAQDIQPFVTQWLQHVDQALQDAAKIQTEYKLETASPAGRIPHLITRHSIGLKANEQKVAIIELNNEEYIKPLLSSSNRTPLPVLVSSDDYMSFQSREKILEDIMKALTDGNTVDITKARTDDNTELTIRVSGMGGLGKSTLAREEYRRVNTELTIGVCGMGGLGKTTLAREVYRRAVKERLFGMDVAMVTVTNKVDLKRIQEEMASMLGLKFDEGTIELGQRASLLKKRLEKTQKDKALIILDDLWEAVNLHKIGIPRDKGVKLLLTSRSHSVLAEMGSAAVFDLKALADVEARTLFEAIVGKEAVLQDPERKSIATKLVEKCQGFPIPIKALATTLKESSLSEWRDALKLNQSNDAYSNLELSYKYLKGDELKSLFLTCALFGFGNKISARDLISYSLGLGLFEGINSVKSARSRLHMLVKSLQESSLLLDSNGDNENVKMHDMVLETAIRIAAKEARALVAKSGSELQKYPTQKLKQATAISLPFGRIGNLPSRIGAIDFPELKILVLIAQGESTELLPAELLFHGMKELNVLHLSRMSFTSNLVSSIGGLENLTTLCLDYCKWTSEEEKEDIAIIGQLRRLQVLSFMGSPIVYLTKEIGNLVELRSLDLRECKYLTKIEPGVLRSLVQLEELYMENGFKDWEVHGVDEPRNAKLEELNELSELSILELHIPSTAMLPKDFPVITQLEKFRILIGDCWDWSSDKTESRTLKLKADSRGILLGKLGQSALDHTEELHLDGLDGSLKKSIHQLSVGGFHGVKRLHVQNSPLVQYVVQSVQGSAFEKLEILSLESLENLEQICHGPPPKLPESFIQLKLLRITKCRKLKSLFDVSLAIHDLPELEEIEISDCKVIEGILQAGDAGVDGNNVDDENGVKPCNIRRLKLENLPELVAFCTKIGDRTTTTGSSSSESALFHCPQVSFPQLESVELDGLGKLKGIWSTSHQLQYMEFTNLQILKVMDCGDLSVCIPYGVLRSLKQLKTLHILRCRSVQQVIGGLDSTGGNCEEEILPQLEDLVLEELPDLTSILPNNATAAMTVFTRLKRIMVEKCDSLINIFSLTTTQRLPDLNILKVAECEKVEAIINIANDLGVSEGIDLPMLESLLFQKLPALVTFVRGSPDIACPMLENIVIEECPKMKSFSAKDVEHLTANDSHICFFSPKVYLPRLEILALKSMESLEEIWPSEHPNEEESFSRLLKLGIYECKSLLSSIVPPSLMKKLQSLEEVLVFNCASVKVVFDFGNPESEALTIPELRSLTVLDLPELKYVFKCNSRVTLALPSLEKVVMYDCKNIVYLFLNATARTLSKLTHLEIHNCESMQQVVSKEDDDKQFLAPMSFLRLYTLSLFELDSLECFSSGDGVFDFPSLESLQICRNSCLKTFIQRPTLDGDQFKSTSPSFFDDRVEFPNLEDFAIREVGMQQVWDSELIYPPDSFSKLKSLQIGKINNLVTLFPSNMLTRIQNLEKLRIHECVELKEIFQIQGFKQSKNDDGTGGNHFEKMKAGNSLDLPSLKEVALGNCNSLTYLFPYSTARSLSKLESIHIEECQSMQEIVSKENDGQEQVVSVQISFPHLRSLLLYTDVSLKSFSSGDSLFEFPSLDTLHICECSSFKTFIQRPAFQDDPLNSILLSLFDGKVEFPNLENIVLDNVGMQNVWNDELHCPSDSFCKLKTLVVQKCPNVVTIIPAAMLSRLQNLESLQIVECTVLKVIVQIEEFNHQNDATAGIEFEKGNFEHGLPSLKEVSVFDCKYLVYLFNTATARTLSELEILQIRNCESMQEVVSKEYGGEVEELAPVSFSNLQDLKLSTLGRLKCFSQGGCMFDFPSLVTLVVNECKSLKTFIQRPGLDDDDHRVHSSSHSLFDDKVRFPNLDKIFLGDVGMHKIWNDELDYPSDSFCKLKTLVVAKCPNVVTIAPWNMLTRLQNLEEVEIYYCIVLEEIFQMEGWLNQKDASAAITFEKLTEVRYGKCPALESRMPTSILEKFREAYE